MRGFISVQVPGTNALIPPDTPGNCDLQVPCRAIYRYNDEIGSGVGRTKGGTRAPGYTGQVGYRYLNFVPVLSGRTLVTPHVISSITG